jgi:fermentation-respiration switch protein FrsA (DUF1100 family)
MGGGIVMSFLYRSSLAAAVTSVFQGTADALVPPATGSALASDRPDLVTLVVTTGAGHVDSWNFDPVRYERYVQTFVAAHSSPAAGSARA